MLTESNQTTGGVFREEIKIIRHFEIARKTGSRWLSECIVGLLHKFAAMLKMRPPKPSHNALDNHLDPVSCTTSKGRIERFRVTFTASVNLYDIKTFSLNLCYTSHYFYPQISSFTLVLSKEVVLDCFKVARLDFLWGIPPKFEH